MAIGYTSGDERKLSVAGGTLTGPLILAADPVTDLGAATKQYVDDNIGGGSDAAKVAKAGDTMTGPLVLPGNPSTSLQAAPKQYVDTGDALALPKAGGTMTGALVLSGGPSVGLHAATKAYVDGLVTNSVKVAAPTGVAATDTTNIQAALDAANTAGGGVVVLQVGTYIIQAGASASLGGVRVYDYTTLAGQGMGITTLKVANSNSASISGVVRTPSAVVTTGATVRDLTIDGNKANKSGTPTTIGFYAGVTPQVTSADVDIVCERVEIKNCTDYGFDPHERVTRLRFTDCLSHGNDGDGFALDGCYDFLVEGCTSYSNGRHGFNFVTGSQRGEVANCRAISNATNGFTAQNGAKYIEFSNCRAESSGGSGFVLNGVAQSSPELDTDPGGYHVLNGCRSRTSALHGFQLVGASGVQLIGCRSADASQTTTNTSSHYRIAESGSTYSTDTTLVGCTWNQTSGVTNAAKYGVDEQSANDGTTYVIACHGGGAVTADLHLLNSASSLYSAHNGTADGHSATSAYVFDTPSKHGYVEWNYDPAMTSSGTGTAATSGTVYLMKITAQSAQSVSNIVASVGTAGATLTSGQNLAALFDSTGARLQVTSDQTTAWGTTGVKSMALGGSVTLTAGADYWVALLSVGTTPAAFVRGSTGVTTPNAGLATTALRFAVNGTSQTSIASSLTPGSNTGTNAQAYWVALS